MDWRKQSYTACRELYEECNKRIAEINQELTSLQEEKEASNNEKEHLLYLMKQYRIELDILKDLENKTLKNYLLCAVTAGVLIGTLLISNLLFVAKPLVNIIFLTAGLLTSTVLLNVAKKNSYASKLLKEYPKNFKVDHNVKINELKQKLLTHAKEEEKLNEKESKLVLEKDKIVTGQNKLAKYMQDAFKERTFFQYQLKQNEEQTTSDKTKILK